VAAAVETQATRGRFMIEWERDRRKPRTEYTEVPHGESGRCRRSPEAYESAQLPGGEHQGGAPCETGFGAPRERTHGIILG